MTATELLREFTFLWAVVDPIGTVPVFIAVTMHMSQSSRRKTAYRAVLIAALVLVFFTIAGEALMASMAIGLSSFQVAGGLVLLIFALQMIFGPSKPDEEIAQIGNAHNSAAFPLAIPSIASPGAILAVVMATDSHRHALTDQLTTLGLLSLVLLSTLALLLLAQPLQRLIGLSGASVISRIMGLLLAAIAVDNILTGLLDFWLSTQEIRA